MSWIDTTFEKAMRAYFILKLESVKGEELYTEYTSIRNAMETIIVDEDISNEEFYKLLSMSFERQHKTLP